LRKTPNFSPKIGKKRKKVVIITSTPGLGEPLWLSGKVMECENKRNEKIPGSIPSPGNL
jgi:hypothetical protein